MIPARMAVCIATPCSIETWRWNAIKRTIPQANFCFPLAITLLKRVKMFFFKQKTAYEVRRYCNEGEAVCILPHHPALVKSCGLRIIDHQGMNTKTSSQCSGDRVVV